jgi:uncharacterized protein (DUF488 family)
MAHDFKVGDHVEDQWKQRLIEKQNVWITKGHANSPARVLTVGHSNRALDEFLTLLRAHGVTLLVDVRKMPRSRQNPQFNLDTLPQSLHEAGIEYEHFSGLGGLRRRSPDSPNTGWKNASFRAYADYMITPEFDDHLQSLLKRCSEQTPTLMSKPLLRREDIGRQFSAGAR